MKGAGWKEGKERKGEGRGVVPHLKQKSGYATGSGTETTGDETVLGALLVVVNASFPLILKHH